MRQADIDDGITNGLTTTEAVGSVALIVRLDAGGHGILHGRVVTQPTRWNSSGSSPVLDHVFVLAPPGGGDMLKNLEAIGLRETYRRVHVGQGTANCCFAFENAFLELLWIDDVDEVRSGPNARCRFESRASGSGDHPIGIAWRGPLAVATWEYRPPYLAGGRSIDVAVDSDRFGVPFLFTFPGSCAPTEWDARRRGTLQASSGLHRLSVEAIHLDVDPGPVLGMLTDQGVVDCVASGTAAVTVRLDGPDRCERIQLPLGLLGPAQAANGST